ncbi:MAG TPA: N-acetylglucosamine-6-phosphate deacetylase [Mucilaginibacter sp.]|jgi:N-acetylglucosamine-6-phosphate deacetylase|nr:N-acetylglucosamine-6-phosphate deacetylase [Mucilaginibacter sp.]
MIALHNLQLISDGTIATGKAVLIEGESIAAVINETEIPSDTNRVDLKGAYLAPGLIDLQVYGSGGKLFGEKYLTDALQQMENDFLQQGTTGFLATIGTNTSQVFERAILAAKVYRSNSWGNFLGLHLEGPFLNPKRKGAHSENLMRKATLAEMQDWVKKADGIIKMMTIAPELQDQEVIDYLHGQGIILASGHSDATYAEGKAFLNKPIKAITHLYNAMPQMHHRAPGIIPAIFEEKPYTSIVADGIHVDYAMIRMAKRELGNKLYLITDAVTTSTEGNYHHEFKGDHYVMQPHGTLSGSSLTMLKAVENCVKHVGINLAEAVNMASLYPAQLLGDTTKGKIEKGFAADMIIFNGDFQVQGTIFKGVI